MATVKVIKTIGETVSESSAPAEKFDMQDVPIYSISRAVEWMKRPENESRIREFAQQAKAVQKNIAQSIDREVTKTGRLMVEIATDDDVREDFINSFLKTLVGDDE